jgi:hypothetical protein
MSVPAAGLSARRRAIQAILMVGVLLLGVVALTRTYSRFGRQAAPKKESLLGACLTSEGPARDDENFGLGQLVANLRDLKPVEDHGASLGGPYVGVGPNPTTYAIVAIGPGVVPYLIARLDSTDLTLNEAIYIIFCLRKLRASEAESTIRRLERSTEDGRLFPDRNMTLDMQIYFYCRDLDYWRKAEGAKEVTERKKEMP